MEKDGEIAVIGDVVLDVYNFVTNKYNPESSASCYLVERTENKPGCAGNVAVNLTTLGSKCTLISVIGEDENAMKLENLLKNSNVNLSLIKDKKRSTIVKERCLHLEDGRYIHRIDYEKKQELEQNHIQEIISKVKNYSLIVVSDYNKDLISKRLMDELKKLNIPIIADTKPVHKDYFNNVTIIKPNAREIEEMTGIENPEIAAQALSKQLNTNILVTMGEKGIYYFGLDGETHKFNPFVKKEEVEDITGAGDSVIATFAHFYNQDWPIKNCVQLANHAGGISVKHPGCYAVTMNDLEGILSSMSALC